MTVNKRIKTAIQSDLHLEDAEQIVLGQEVEKLESAPTKNPSNKIPSRFVSKEENMVKVMFRALSAHSVEVGSRRQMNFGAKEGILRRSKGKLLGRPIMTNHSWNVDNIKGHVEAVSWDEGDDNNPAGINVLLAVDGERHPVLANNLASGRIKAVSVTVEYSWEYSHKELADMPEYKAYHHLGKKALVHTTSASY